jgi:hypothetical protein
MSYGDGYFGIDPCDESDYSEQLPEPEPEPWMFTFRDGSKIIIREDDKPGMILPHRKTLRLWTAEEVDMHLDIHQLNATEAIDYITKNYEN